MRRAVLDLMFEDWAHSLYSKRVWSIKGLVKVDKAINGMVLMLPLSGSPGYTRYPIDTVVESLY